MDDVTQQQAKLDGLKQLVERLQAKVAENKLTENVDIREPEGEEEAGIKITGAPLWFQKLKAKKIK